MKRDCRCPLAKHEHGTAAGYWADDCHCFPCRIAYVDHVYRQRHGQPTTPTASIVNGAGTRRRVEALHAIGWSGAEIGAMLGVGYSAVNQLRKQALVFPRTADRVRVVYDELWATPSTGPRATQTRRWAARRGFPPPLAWDDDEIDDPAAEPHTPGKGGWDHSPCGTEAAHRRHLRNGETPCFTCVDAARIARDNRKKVA